jgi:hypothetical protein
MRGSDPPTSIYADTPEAVNLSLYDFVSQHFVLGIRGKGRHLAGSDGQSIQNPQSLEKSDSTGETGLWPTLRVQINLRWPITVSAN